MRPSTRRRLALPLLLTVTLVLSACAGEGGAVTELVDGVASGVCSDQPEVDDQFTLSCRQAVQLAEARLGWLHWPITATEFHRGGPCPPNARCFIAPTQGSVIFHFKVGDPVVIRIALDATGLAATGDPEPVPAWMFDAPQESR
jgi:hypothetical protein